MSIHDQIEAHVTRLMAQREATDSRLSVLSGITDALAYVPDTARIQLQVYGDDEFILSVNLNPTGDPVASGDVLVGGPLIDGAGVYAVPDSAGAPEQAPASDAGSEVLPDADAGEAEPELIPAADPYSVDEEAQILQLHREGTDNATIARVMGRRPQGFHHAVTRIVRAANVESSVPDGVDAAIWQHIAAVGNSAMWPAAADLELATLMLGGAKLAHAAAQLGVDRDDVEARWQALVPNRNVIGVVAATEKALRERFRQMKEAGQ